MTSDTTFPRTFTICWQNKGKKKQIKHGWKVHIRLSIRAFKQDLYFSKNNYSPLSHRAFTYIA